MQAYILTSSSSGSNRQLLASRQLKLSTIEVSLVFCADLVVANKVVAKEVLDLSLRHVLRHCFYRGLFMQFCCF